MRKVDLNTLPRLICKGSSLVRSRKRVSTPGCTGSDKDLDSYASPTEPLPQGLDGTGLAAFQPR